MSVKPAGARESRGSDGAADPLRLFFALWPDAPARDALARLAREIASRCRGREPLLDNLHVTLAFLGEVAPGRIVSIESIGERVAHEARTFTLILDRLGGARGSGVAWLAATGISPELARLHERLSARLDEHGFAVETRRFRPHATLARHCLEPVPRAAIAPIAWSASTLALIASDLQPDGPRYRELAAWRFAGVRS